MIAYIAAPIAIGTEPILSRLTDRKGATHFERMAADDAMRGFQQALRKPKPERWRYCNCRPVQLGLAGKIANSAQVAHCICASHPISTCLFHQAVYDVRGLPRYHMSVLPHDKDQFVKTKTQWPRWHGQLDEKE
ncbi:uncharacterized protein UBRO_20399 [Ustilago bromivora]|uniref:Uncharacterized protein n=1 Tax=Ustilago bromivora TaxID=307758 RepID=A0A1K0H409_9BASI|nr:uncharacterized protein UBRO_20399 [Ustilago bromivora]